MRAIILQKADKNTQAGAALSASNIALWIVQVLLAVVFVLHGFLMVAPPAELLELINAQLGPGLRLFIGVAEVLAAAGLILPGLTRILPFLTALAAAGLMIVMASATLFHLLRGESGNAITTAVLFVLVTAVAYLRWKVKPIAARVST
jgi:putative oxidoreductase